MDKKKPSAASWLKGHWCIAVSSELLIVVAEAFLIVFGAVMAKKQSLPVLPVVLAVDILLLSPLKAGRTFLYDTIATGSTHVRIRLLFRYYTHGFVGAILWRIGYWARYGSLCTLFALPGAALMTLRSIHVDRGLILEDDLLHIALTFAAYILLIIGFLSAWIFSVRYDASAFFLPYRNRTRALFADSAKTSKGKTEPLLGIRFRYVRWAPLFVFVAPYFYASAIYHMEQAIAIRGWIGRFPENKLSQALQHEKNHGMIQRIS